MDPDNDAKPRIVKAVTDEKWDLIVIGNKTRQDDACDASPDTDNETFPPGDIAGEEEPMIATMAVDQDSCERSPTENASCEGERHRMLM